MSEDFHWEQDGGPDRKWGGGEGGDSSEREPANQS